MGKVTPFQLLLQNRIKQEGPLSFEDFMRELLYNESYGYYKVKKTTYDYFTSVMVHPAFGALLAYFVLLLNQKLGKECSNILDLGAREGLLMNDIKTFISSTKTGYDYKFFTADRVPYKDVVKPEQIDRFSGVVVSNELLDAFPVRRFEVKNNALFEWWVDVNNDGEFIKRLFSPKDTKLQKRLEGIFESLPNGYIGEACFEYENWVNLMGSTLDKGYLLIIDYGGSREEIYSKKRPFGTLNCAYKHTEGHSPFMRVGEQDVTAMVDFEEVHALLTEQGFKKQFAVTQEEFLVSLGIDMWIEDLRKGALLSPENRPTIQKLNVLKSSTGLGSFKVVLYSKKSPDFSFQDIVPCSQPVPNESAYLARQR